VDGAAGVVLPMIGDRVTLRMSDGEDYAGTIEREHSARPGYHGRLASVRFDGRYDGHPPHLEKDGTISGGKGSFAGCVLLCDLWTLDGQSSPEF